MDLLQNSQLLSQSLGRNRPTFQRPQRQTLTNETLSNYMPVMGRAKAFKPLRMPSPESMQEGINAFKGMMAERRASLMADQHKQDIADFVARNKKIVQARQKMDWMRSTPESRTLARIQQFMAERGKSMGNSFHF